MRNSILEEIFVVHLLRLLWEVFHLDKIIEMMVMNKCIDSFG